MHTNFCHKNKQGFYFVVSVVVTQTIFGLRAFERTCPRKLWNSVTIVKMRGLRIVFSWRTSTFVQVLKDQTQGIELTGYFSLLDKRG